jgi:glutathione peroxidase
MKHLYVFLCLIYGFSISANDFYSFKVPDVYGKIFSFEALKGKAVLVVNTASKCGYTDQYKELEEIHSKFKSKGFHIIAIPSNDFGGQEPLSNSQIAEFCKLNYNVSFQILSKQPVTGKSKHPLFRHLIQESKGNKEIGWNFEKFLIDKSGKVVGRFPSKVSPTSIELQNAIKKVL